MPLTDGVQTRNSAPGRTALDRKVESLRASNASPREINHTPYRQAREATAGNSHRHGIMRKSLNLRVRRMVEIGSQLRSGIIGQGFSFLAMLLPIIFGKLDQLSFLVVTSSVAGIASYTCTWSYASIFPGIKDEHECAVSTKTSFLLMFLVCGVMLVISLDFFPLDKYLKNIAWWSSGLTLVIGSNMIVTAIFVRNRDFDSISHMRLISGILNFALVLVACLSTFHFIPLLVAATIVAFGLTALWGGIKGHPQAIQRGICARVAFREMVAYLRRNSDAALAALLGGGAFQIVGLSTPLLGPLANAWAIAIRLGGGFSTVTQQVVAPLIEVDYAHFIRTGAEAEAAKLQKKAYMLGCLYATFCAVIVAIAIILSRAGDAVPQLSTSLLVVGAGVFTFSIISTSLIPRNLVIAGGQRLFLTWAAVKVVVGIILLLSTSGLSLLVGLAITEALFQWLYFVAASRQLSGQNKRYKHA